MGNNGEFVETRGELEELEAVEAVEATLAGR
jgi:hypothetical protein